MQTENPLQNAYIGEYTEAYEYSYDFTTGSVADLQSKGWTVPTGSVVDSNGYYNSDKNRASMVLPNSELNTVLQTATKITMTFTWSATSIHQRVFALRSSGTEEVILYGDGEPHSGGNQAGFKGVAVVNESIAYGNNGVYTVVFTVDLGNKTWEYSGTNHSTLTGSITDAIIANIRTVNEIAVYDELNARIHSIAVRVE